MKRVVFILVFLILIGSIFRADLSAQQDNLNTSIKGWNAGSRYNNMFNVNTVVFISGVVISIEKIVPLKGMSCCAHLRIKIDKDTVPVHLGPVAFMESQELKINLNDFLTIEGSLIVFESNPTIIAAVVNKGNEKLLLRNAKGFPVWCGSIRN